MLTTLLLLLTLATSPDNPCATSAVAYADADLLTAQRMYFEAITPRAKSFALAFVASALERKRTAMVVCTPSLPKNKANPYVEDPLQPKEDPFDPNGDDGELAYQMTVDLVGSFAGLVRP
jgi:hypothetical protein